MLLVAPNDFKNVCSATRGEGVKGYKIMIRGTGVVIMAIIIGIIMALLQLPLLLQSQLARFKKLNALAQPLSVLRSDLWIFELSQ